jgi:FlaA1/EpsC-like NDP-sugar epimerase
MMTTYNDAIAAALNGKALLFTGAGFSFGSKNLLKEAPRDSRKFALFLYKEAGTADGDTDLANASSYFLKKLKDPNVLIDLLKAEYTITSISDAHKTLGAVSWLRTYWPSPVSPDTFVSIMCSGGTDGNEKAIHG